MGASTGPVSERPAGSGRRMGGVGAGPSGRWNGTPGRGPLWGNRSGCGEAEDLARLEDAVGNVIADGKDCR